MTFDLYYPLDESLVLDLVLILTPLLSPPSENGFVVVIWIGQHVPGEFISKVFGAASHAQINTDMVGDVRE